MRGHWFSREFYKQHVIVMYHPDARDVLRYQGRRSSAENGQQNTLFAANTTKNPYSLPICSSVALKLLLPEFLRFYARSPIGMGLCIIPMRHPHAALPESCSIPRIVSNYPPNHMIHIPYCITLMRRHGNHITYPTLIRIHPCMQCIFEVYVYLKYTYTSVEIYVYLKYTYI